MQQIKCASCEYTKFFVNSIAETSMISCCECGASFIIGTPTTQPAKEPEPVQIPTGETENEFPEEPRKIKAEELEQPIEQKEEVVQKKPLIRKLSPEEKQAMLLEMEKGDE